jgi:hypothetical protein
LGWTFVPDDLWELLSPGQQDLHLLWTKKLVPLYDGYGRIRRRHLREESLQTIRMLLEVIGRGGMSFQTSSQVETHGSRNRTLHSRVSWDDLHARVAVNVLTSPNQMQRISISARDQVNSFEVRLVWLPQDDDARGSVMLFPDAMQTSHNFGIAAFNRLQFAAICDALTHYLRPSHLH